MEQWLPHKQFCVTFLHLTGYHLPASYCINLRFPDLQIKFPTATREGEKCPKWCHSLCRMIQSMLFLHFFSLAIFSFACSFQHRLFWWRKHFSVNLEQIFNSHGKNSVYSENIDIFINSLAASQVCWARNEKGLWQCYQPRISVL